MESSQRSEIFLLYQARQKADEIELMAREEHNKELKKLVQAQHTKLEIDFDFEKKQIDRNSKIDYSVAKNDQRIQLLSAERAIVDEAIEKTRAKLRQLTAEPEYEKILVKLIEQGLKNIDEQTVSLRFLERDYPIAEKYISESIDEKYNVHIKKDDPLDESAIGGVVLENENSTIKCDNTFEGRLHLTADGGLPAIRRILK